MQNVRKNFKICATCTEWNGYAGGQSVRPKEYSPNQLEFDPNEKQLCFRNHVRKPAMGTCFKWKQKYS